MKPEQLSTNGRKLFEMIEFDENEQLIAEIRKHPFGLFIVYITGFAITMAVSLVFFLVPILLSANNSGFTSEARAIQPYMTLLGLILVIGCLIGTGIGAYLYISNVILVTSEKLAQVLYKSIFNRKISQLSIGDVQDVTVNQVGLTARLFNYGTIIIETAGEQDNYDFTYVPDPYKKSKLIVGSHEVNLTKYGN
jgi:uncharacterized membrane protein YdbT with pleckstrin-like domain